MNKTYHIYFEDKCLFKNLDQHEFDVIWGRIYRSYHTDSITYECLNNPVEFKGKKINYISVFEKQCREQNFEDDDED